MLESASINGVLHHPVVATNQDEMSEKSKRKLDTPISDVDAARPRKRASSEKASQLPLFTCPFYRRQPGKFVPGTKAWIACAAKGWTIPRLKEHIYRRHCLSSYRCSRCFKTYDKEEHLTEHQRSTIPCSLLQDKPECEGVDASQKIKLRRKKLGKTDCDKWHEMYRIIFSLDQSDEVPTPYWEKVETGKSKTCPTLLDFQEHLETLILQGDNRASADAQICMKLLKAFHDPHCSSESTDHPSVPTLDSSSSRSDLEGQGTEVQSLANELSEEIQTEQEGFDFLFEDVANLDFRNFETMGDIYQGSYFYWEPDGS